MLIFIFWGIKPLPSFVPSGSTGGFSRKTGFRVVTPTVTFLQATPESEAIRDVGELCSLAEVPVRRGIHTLKPQLFIDTISIPKRAHKGDHIRPKPEINSAEPRNPPTHQSQSRQRTNKNQPLHGSNARNKGCADAANQPYMSKLVVPILSRNIANRTGRTRRTGKGAQARNPALRSVQN